MSLSPEWWAVIFNGVIAAFTIVLAISTVYLWLVTRKVAKSTQLNAEALITAERPQLLMDNIKLHGLKRDGFSATTVYPNLPSNQPAVIGVTFGIKNYGKSPAWPTSIKIHFDMLQVLPDQPKYGEATAKIIGPVVAGNFIEGKQTLRPNPNVVLSNEDTADIYAGKQHLFLWGFVEYTDFSRKPLYKSRFAYKYKVGEGWDPGDRFDPCGPASYWEHT